MENKRLFLTHVQNIENPEIDFWYVDHDTSLESLESYYQWFISDKEMFTIFEIELDLENIDEELQEL